MVAGGAVGMWESGVLCRISKRGGNGGKVLSDFLDFSTVSRARHFLSALQRAGNKVKGSRTKYVSGNDNLEVSLDRHP